MICKLLMELIYLIFLTLCHKNGMVGNNIIEMLKIDFLNCQFSGMAGYESILCQFSSLVCNYFQKGHGMNRVNVSSKQLKTF